MSLLTPVKYPVKFYSWQDDQAPKLQDADGVLKTIIKACLVTGYGDKVGAGWVMSDEDGNDMTITPPYNPSGVSVRVHNSKDNHYLAFIQHGNQIATSNLNARTNFPSGNEWFLFATDFAFLFCYQNIQYHSTPNNNFALYIGQMSNIDPASAPNFLVNHYDSIQRNGRVSGQSPFALMGSCHMLNVLDGTQNNIRHVLSLGLAENHGGVYMAQRVFISQRYVAPYYYALSGRRVNSHEKEQKQIEVGGRPMFRYVNLMTYISHTSYIPLDYWEL